MAKNLFRYAVELTFASLGHEFDTVLTRTQLKPYAQLQ